MGFLYREQARRQRQNQADADRARREREREQKEMEALGKHFQQMDERHDAASCDSSKEKK